MFIEKEYMESWMKRIMERFDRLENSLIKPPPERERQTLDGELLLDNQDLCMMLNVSKRSLQRYRSLGWLPYKQIDQKMYYLQSDVERFIKKHFEKRYKPKR
ncbi:DNA-binding protein [Bacteroidia bacterium]|nr:DNA-binding protein [Bacteroidia bacterium]GHT03430.1 DNA-binding protein [Bacteroidia bacterium]GHT45107.1 DNA-binding protein [Bacteroidia bacterium]